MKMSMIKVSLLAVLVLAPLATQLAWAAAPAAGEGTAAAEHEGKKPEGLLPELPTFLLPVPFSEIIQCISSLSGYVTEIFGFIHHHAPLSEIACDVIRGLPASCADGLHHLLNIPFDQSQLVAAICGAAAPPPLY